jgi:hypothetical protein
MLVANLSRFGNLRAWLANFACCKICQEKKEESIRRNVQIEIGESVREKPEARDKG